MSQKAVAGGEQELDLPDVHIRAADAAWAVTARTLFGEDSAPARNVAGERPFVELGVRAPVPRSQKGDDRFDVGSGQWTAAQRRPSRHGGAVSAIVDGL